MKINSEDIPPYATALSSIVGSVVVAPFLMIKDKVTSTFLEIWRNPDKEHPCQMDMATHNSCDTSLTESIDDTGWNVVTIIGDSALSNNVCTI